jgi:hypothetical protein
MGARFRSWWQQIKQHPYATGIVVFLAFILLIFLAYRFGWDWTGFTGGENKVTTTMITPGTTTTTTPRATVATEQQPAKTLWDWLGLFAVLTIPAVVGLGAAWFTVQQGKESNRENTDNQREAALQAYIDRMSELLLEKKLRESAGEDEVRVVARVRTMTILPRLDATRKSSVLIFLHESGLIEKSKYIIDLRGANLSRANLRTDNLNAANLGEVDLREADLSGADLREANLGEAKLNGANLSNTMLWQADLSWANLSGAINTAPEQLAEVKSLQGATMPDGSIHP